MAGTRRDLVGCLTAIFALSFLAYTPQLRADDDPPLPHACPLVITGPTSVCSGSDIILTVQNNTTTSGMNPTSYAWSQIGGTGSATFSPNNTASTTVTGGTPGTVDIKCTVSGTVVGIDGCSSIDLNYSITVNANPVCTISGANSVCENSLGHIYSGPGGMSSYLWSISGNGSINGSNTGSSVTVDAGLGGSFTLSLAITDANGCTNVGACDKMVTVNPNPVCSITGSNSVCENSLGHIYSGPGGMSSYLWSISGNGSINGSNTGSSVTVDAGLGGSFTLSLAITDANGCTNVGACDKMVTVNPNPVCSITGSNSVCENSLGHIYSGPGGMSSYLWSISGNGSINGSNTGSSVTVDAGLGGSFTLSLAITDANGCTNVGACDKMVTVNANPVCSISGPSSVCEDSTGHVYSGPGGMSSYAWSISGDGTIVGSMTDPTVTVDAGSPGSFTLSLMITDANGCSNVGACDKVVPVLPLPDVTITHNATGDLCPNWAGYVASVPSITCVPPAPGFPIYSWSISAGGTIVGSTSNPSVSFKVDTSNPTVTLTVTVTGCNGCSATSSEDFDVCLLGTCQTGQLRLVGSTGTPCFKNNSTYIVQLYMDNVSCPTAGFQAFLQYDSTKLQYIAAGSSYTAAPFGLPTAPINGTIGSLNHPVLGKLVLSSGVNPFSGQIPVTGTNVLLATLEFKVISDTGCDGVYVDFRSDMPITDGPRPPTRLTDLSGFGFGTITQAPVSVAGLVVVSPASIRIDGLAPTASYLGSIASCYPTQAAAIAAAIANSMGSDNCTGPLTLHTDPVLDTDGCTFDIRVWYSDGCGNEMDPPDFLTFVTRVDNTPPMITCPMPNPTLVECNASILPANTGTATASDNCSGLINISYSDLSSLVNPTTPNGWSLFATLPGSNTPGGNGTADYVVGPAVPPLGTGSAHFNTGTNGSQSAQLRNSSWAGTMISALTALKYSTYATAWNGSQLPYLTIWVDYTGDTVADDRLWFEPAYSTAAYSPPLVQGPPMLNTWQTWDTLQGNWYSDNHFGPGSASKPLTDYLALHPTAKIVNAGALGGIRIASGFASVPNVFDANVDAFEISTATSGITYNFEPAGCGDYDITRTWTATDFCGNSSSCVQIIEVRDTTNPVITCPPDASIECDEWAFSSAPGIPFGQAEGGIMIYYNDNGGGENPANQAYLKAQFSYANTNAMKWTFSSVPLTGGPVLTWASPALFNDLGQYGYDFVLDAPTHVGLPTTPFLLPYDNTNNSAAGRVVTAPGNAVLWKIADYKDGAPNGPINPANVDINSLIRAVQGASPTSPDLTNFIIAQSLSLSGTVYTAQISGQLQSDNMIHWYNPAFPNSPMASLNLNGKFYYSGTLTYDSAGDTGTDLKDFYEGTINVVANSPNVGLGFATATDNCTPFPVVTYTDGPLVPNVGCTYTGTVTRTWKAVDACGNEATCNQLITIVDNTAPTITCAADVVVNPSLAELADCDADGVVIVAPTSTDNCDSTVSIVGIRSDTLAVVTPGPNSFPPGVTTITWTATDDCNNSSQCIQTITVNASSINVVVELSPTIVPLPVDRCISFEVFNCPNVTPELIDRVMTFTDVAGAAIATDTICVPLGTVTCVTARDRLHTLRSRVEAGDGLTGSGPYTANFTGKRAGEPGLPAGTGHRLVGGNLNDDEFIDILDFGTWAGQYNISYGTGDTTCATASPHSDISGDGLVESGDFSFIAINFLMFREANCCGLLNVTAGGSGKVKPQSTGAISERVAAPISRISVQELRARNMDSLIAGDINRDGWLDMHDVVLAWLGVPPATSPETAGAPTPTSPAPGTAQPGDRRP